MSTPVNEDVVRYIIQHVLGVECSSLADWKRMLPMLAVCKRWRKIARPLVYKCMIVESTSEIYYNHEDVLGDQRSRVTSLKTMNKSNLALISNNVKNDTAVELLMRRKRVLKIKIHYCFSPVANIDSVLLNLQLNTNILCGLNSLHFELSAQENVRILDSFVLERLEKIQMQAAVLYMLTPHVQNLKIVSSAMDIISYTASVALMNNYAHQLNCIDSNTYTLASVSKLAQNIERATLLCDCSRYAVLPKLSPANLKSLKLLCMSHSMPWDWLTNGGNHIEFDSLESLDVKVVQSMNLFETDVRSWIGPYDRFFYSINAPSLQYVSVEACSFTFSLLVKLLESVSSLKRLQITLPANNVIRLYDTKPSAQLRRIIYKHSLVVLSTTDAIELANDIFCVPNLAEGSKLELSEFSAHLDITGIGWTFLKILTIYTEIDFEDVAKMLEIMTGLLVLDARNVSISISGLPVYNKPRRSYSEPICLRIHESSLRVASIKLQRKYDCVGNRLYVKSYLMSLIKALSHVFVY